MTAPALALAAALGVLIGGSLGLLGAGGSLLTVPILIYVFNQGPVEATATSLVIVAANALLAAVTHWRQGGVVWRVALEFGVAGVAGAFAGFWLNTLVAGRTFLFLFGLLMVAGAAAMARRPQARDEGTVRPGRSAAATAGAGVLIGVLTGFFGVGGGFIVVPALHLIVGLPMRHAVGTSLVIIVINSLTGFAARLGVGAANWPLILAIMAGGAAGAVLGGRAAHRLPGRTLARAFAGVLALAGLVVIIRHLP
ncbi:MAG: sulfite exporter TauE/SafE family protein [Armatimonadetes bacterium]|nr:sulfite exporter TauE/SafE family protein [Armatimonadota bacterium]